MTHIVEMLERARVWWTDYDRTRALLTAMHAERQHYVAALSQLHAEQTAARLRDLEMAAQLRSLHEGTVKLAELVAAMARDTTPSSPALRILPAHGVTAVGPAKRPAKQSTKKNKS